MTNGSEGQVYWSSRAQRFYQEGRRGAVSREQAARFLEYDAEAGRYRDPRGRFVPADLLGPPVSARHQFVTRDDQGRPFIRAEFNDRLIDRTAAVQERLGSNQMVQVRIVVRTPDNKVHVSYVTSKLGGRPNIQDLELAATRKARADLVNKGYDLTTNDVNNSTVRTDYIRRNVEVRRL
jgi:hypothetical protein